MVGGNAAPTAGKILPQTPLHWLRMERQVTAFYDIRSPEDKVALALKLNPTTLLS
jgi:hypothetical protein